MINLIKPFLCLVFCIEHVYSSSAASTDRGLTDDWWSQHGSSNMIHKLGHASRLGLLSTSWLLEFFVNPFTPLYICDHHYGATSMGLPTTIPLNLSPFDEHNSSIIRDFEIVCCETVAFEAFASRILPKLRVKIILFTYRWHLPQIKRSPLTDQVRTHSNVAFWFSQNPIYPSDDSYSGFPYGIQESALIPYSAAFLKYSGVKTTGLTHLPPSLTNPVRKMLPKIPFSEYWISRVLAVRDGLMNQKILVKGESSDSFSELSKETFYLFEPADSNIPFP